MDTPPERRLNTEGCSDPLQAWPAGHYEPQDAHDKEHLHRILRGACLQSFKEVVKRELEVSTEVTQACFCSQTPISQASRARPVVLVSQGEGCQGHNAERGHQKACFCVVPLSLRPEHRTPAHSEPQRLAVERMLLLEPVLDIRSVPLMEQQGCHKHEVDKDHP